MKRKVVRQGGSLMVSIPSDYCPPFKEGMKLSVGYDRGKLTYSLGDLGNIRLPEKSGPSILGYPKPTPEPEVEREVSSPLPQPQAEQAEESETIEKPDYMQKGIDAVVDGVLDFFGVGTKPKRIDETENSI